MSDEVESIFTIPHSLPCSAHAAAVATRTPSGPPKVEVSQYMPSYVGMIELPGTRLKHNGLRRGIPFFPNPYYVLISNPENNYSHSTEPLGANCLESVSYLQTNSSDGRYKEGKSFSIIRASSSTLWLDIARSITCNGNCPESIESRTYAQVPYSYKIRGVKYCDKTSNYVIVNFREGTKLIQLDSQFSIPSGVNAIDDSETENETTAGNGIDSIIPNQAAIKFVGSFPGDRGITTVDACISRNQDLLNVASCDRKNLYVRLYDISRPKKAQSVVSRDRDDEARIRLDMTNSEKDRKKTLRSFIPSAPVIEELHQIDSNPSHLIQSVITTSSKVSQIDPRINAIVEHYADKFKLTNASVTEQFRQIKFSRNNDYQLYLMSNEKLRVLDRRFRSKDMSIQDHMLDSSTYDMMTMKLIRLPSSNLEIVCLASYGELNLISFDRSHHSQDLIKSAGELVNPESLHLPVHEPSPVDERFKDELYGLAMDASKIFDSRDVLFSTLQLSHGGRLCARGFSKSRDRALRDIGTFPRLRSENFRTLSSSNNQSNTDTNLRDCRPLRTTEPPFIESEYFDMLDKTDLLESEKKLTSNRAKAKYESMKRSLRRE